MAITAIGTHIAAQQGDQKATLITTGQIIVNAHSVPYSIRHLPISSFPQLPALVQQVLDQRGCVIPQTYQAHRPENVIHASLEHANSPDWAVLCSAEGKVSLLVFFAVNFAEPFTLISVPEIDCLHQNITDRNYGFDWGIDPATPQQVHDAQAGMNPRPQRLDHDALRDSIVNGHIIYRYYANGNWTEVARTD